MEEEIWALDANDTFDELKWVYKVKYNPNDLVNWYKALLVAKGFAQTYNIDYDETFGLVAKMMMVLWCWQLLRHRGGIFIRWM